MARQARTEPSLTEWAVLGLLREGSAHGWDVARAFAPDGPDRERVDGEPAARLPRDHRSARPRVCRGSRQHAELERAANAFSSRRRPADGRRSGAGSAGPWCTCAISAPSSCSSSSSSSARASTGCRSSGPSSTSSSAASTGSCSGWRRARASTGRSRCWRLTSARAARAFVEALLDERAEEPVQYHAIGIVRSAHTELDGMPLQPAADRTGPSRIDVTEPHRGCLVDLDGFSHVWVIAHLHESVGWGPVVDPFLDDRPRGTFASRSPHRPNPISISLCTLAAVDGEGIVVDGPRPPRRNARPRPEAVRAALRRARRRRRRRLVRGPRRADLRAHLRRALRAAEQAPSVACHGMGEDRDRARSRSRRGRSRRAGGARRARAGDRERARGGRRRLVARAAQRRLATRRDP